MGIELPVSTPFADFHAHYSLDPQTFDRDSKTSAAYSIDRVGVAYSV
jgi:hypothetical protein